MNGSTGKWTRGAGARRPLRRLGGWIAEDLVLLPRSAVRLLRCVRGPAAARRLLVEVIGVALGVLAWFVALLTLLATARGPFFGLVVAGPYDTSWGGPTLAGAWTVHALVWLGLVLVVAALSPRPAALHRAVAEHLLGGRRRAWVVPLAVLVAAGTVLLVIGWVGQL